MSIPSASLTPPSGPEPRPLQREEDLLLALTHALQAAGTSSVRIEVTAQALAEHLGVEVQVFSTPTALFAAFGPLGTQRVTLMREVPGPIHLERLSDLTDLVERVVAGLPCEEALEELRRIEAAPESWSAGSALFAVTLACATAGLLFGGSPYEVLGSAVAGFLIGWITILASAFERFARLALPLAGATAALVGAIATRLELAPSPITIAVASLIVLLPGLSLTMAFKELALGHLASGTARTVGALIELTLLGFGTAVGLWLGRQGQIVETLTAPIPHEWGWLGLSIAALLAPLSFTVLFRARATQALPIVGVGALAMLCTQTLGPAFGPLPGAFLSAFTVGVAANLWARHSSGPSAVLQVPGLILLVPGSLGYRSVWALLESDPITGVDAAFQTVTLAVALAMGIVLANAAIPTRA